MRQNVNTLFPHKEVWMNTADVCTYSGLSPSSIYRAIIKGRLRVSKVTGKNLFKKEWIDNYLEGGQ